MCVAASIYMYRELKTTKDEMENVKGINGKITSFLSQMTPVRIPGPGSRKPQNVQKEPAFETQVDESNQENQESEEESSE